MTIKSETLVIGSKKVTLFAVDARDGTIAMNITTQHDVFKIYI